MKNRKSYFQLVNLFSKTRRRSTDSPSLTTTSSYNPLMHSGFYTVEHLDVKFGKLVVFIGGSLLDITKGRGVNDVTNNKSLDGLVLGDSLSSGNAPVEKVRRSCQSLNQIKILMQIVL